MMRYRKSIAMFTAVIFLFGATFFLFTNAASITVIDDVFADGNSSNQDLANNSMALYSARNNPRTDAVGSVNFAINSASSDAYWAHFTNSGSPVTLNVGDSIKFTSVLSLTYTTSSGGIRFGLLDSKGTRLTTNQTGGLNNAAFGDDTGYAAEVFPNTAGPFAAFYRRDVTSPTTNNIFNSLATTAGLIPISGTGSPTTRLAFASGSDYTFTYTVTRVSATETQISARAVGPGVDETHTGTEISTTPYASFDYFLLRIGGSALATAIRYKQFKVELTPAAPTITTQPAPPSQTVSVGANVQYSVGATGTGISYQWLKDGNPVSASNPTATTANLQLTNVQTTDSGVYSVNVINAGGTTPSDPVNLTVVSGPTDPPPVINQQPQNTTAVIGTPASLSVTATGPNMTYQWFKEGSPLGGETNPTLSFASVQLSDTANYTVNISNGGGTVSSDPARLTVISTMTATAFEPNNTSGVCVDKILNITFNQTPKLGTSGQIRVYEDNGTLFDTIDLILNPQTKTIGGTAFRYLPIIINGNAASIYLHNQLAYNKTYYVVMDTGVLTDLSNVPYVGFSNVNTFRFTTKAAAPPANSSVLTVNANGSGDFCTIQGAVDFVPSNNAQRVIINVKNGTYTELVNIPSTKPLLTVKGESRNGTLQKYPNNNNLNPNTTTRPSFNVNTGANDFNLENITLQNSTPQGGSQAEAFRSYALRTTVNSVNLLSFQDTILTQGSAYFTNSYVEGDVDFMWGTGNTFFKNTELKMMRENLGYYTQIRNGSGAFGNVYVNCRFTKAPSVTNGSYLGRIDPDDFPFSQVVLIDSQMDSHIIPVGWRFDNPTNTVDSTNYPNIRYWESNSRALDGTTPIDCSQRHPISRNDCSNPLTQAERDFYTNPANIVGFTPQEKLTAAVTFANLTQVYDGTPKSVTTATDPSGLPIDITYNGSPTAPTNAGTYTVVATVIDTNYQGTATATLTISPASASVSLSNLTQNYDGTPKSATVATNPSGLSVSVTYNGSATVPSAVGNYTVTASVTDPNYTGSATGNLNIKSLVKAFPTAEGAGAYSIGGRGGDTYHVTNLNDSGAGSLREGILSATSARTIVFDLSGTIYLNTDLRINKPFITIAGQTAPGDGITIAGRSTIVTDTQHVVIRYLRFRGGDINCPSMQGDAVWVDKSKDVIIDHVSASWSIDESLSVTESDRITVQWSFISESLNNSCHLNDEGTAFERHGFGSLIRYGSGRISYHHNFYAHHFNRNPRVGDDITLDFVNNVIYDWGTDASYSGGAAEGITKVNYVGNYLVAGPNTPSNKRARAFNGGSINTWIYQSGNAIDSNLNGVHDGTDTGWNMFVNSYTQQAAPLGRNVPSSTLAIEIDAQTAESAYTSVLATAGASRTRDSVDNRLVSEVTNETGAMIDSQTQVGGFPMLNSLPAPIDTDQDGIPDNWEIARGLNPNDPNDATAIDANGYSYLENYVNQGLFAPTAATASVSGRVLVGKTGISRVQVVLTNTATGESRIAQTNSFGVYNFDEVPAGSTYIVTVQNRRYNFNNPTRVVTVTENIGELDFIADN